MLVGICLQPLRWLLKPYVGADVRVPLALLAAILMLAGAIRSVIAPKREVTPEFKLNGRGLAVGLMAGLGMAAASASRFKPVPSYLGFLGLGLFWVACALILRDRLKAEAKPPA